eukprot:CAMPEP_0204213170 /NCGR_PEP_ID=MMETSP0361-20130328/75805_1 /ASSEMBLY_ACC=CAM_ASM_000343 /TAXON_ID=268821 /ORGANISM="Scrippsiella Hangoei, Strain SHTV-5" /LENGTH=66 /DNA_ID=CAMNT_0051177603 /DNA_START=145 /DNA_END=347 /DNA_ORIENTATION=+
MTSLPAEAAQRKGAADSRHLRAEVKEEQKEKSSMHVNEFAKFGTSENFQHQSADEATSGVKYEVEI